MDLVQQLGILFETYFGNPPAEIVALRGDGSERRIYRLRDNHRSVIGIIGNNAAENQAFVSFSRHFFAAGLKVPEIYAENLSKGIYLEEDLGNYTLFEWMNEIRSQQGFTPEITEFYKKALTQLPHFQIRAGADIDYSLCYQHKEFGWASMVWDTHYFRHRFLDMFYKIPYDQGELETDFIALIEYLMEENRTHFLYRDFQSRNIMVKNGEPYFIDYQSGRRGALQYDVASLLYDAKADLPQPVRDELLEHYLTAAQELIPIDEQRFRDFFYGFVFIRIMQACGAYGYLGIVKKKPHFLKSVPYAMQNLELLLQKDTIIKQFPVLHNILNNLAQDKKLRTFQGA